MGNNMSLLEDPLETAYALAPCAATGHRKDMALEPCEDGFLLAKVPLAEGFPDLKVIVDTIRSARPQARFTLGIITRNPLGIPCQGKCYWQTMGRVPASDHAHSLELVHRNGKLLQCIEQPPAEERFQIERENYRACPEFGKGHLDLWSRPSATSSRG